MTFFLINCFNQANLIKFIKIVAELNQIFKVFNLNKNYLLSKFHFRIIIVIILLLVFIFKNYPLYYFIALNYSNLIII